MLRWNLTANFSSSNSDSESISALDLSDATDSSFCLDHNKNSDYDNDDHSIDTQHTSMDEDNDLPHQIYLATSSSESEMTLI